MRVLVVGEALMDVVTTADGRQTAHVGGSPLNVAVGLARLGVPTTFVAQVGPDRHGEEIARHLQASGVDFRPLLPTPRGTSTAAATLSAAGSATYEFDLTWDPAELPDIGGYDALHVGSVAAARQPGAGKVVSLAAAARRQGLPVTFDPNVRLAVEPDSSVWQRAFAEVLPHTSVVKMSDEDAAVLAPDLPAADVAARLAEDGRLVVVTCGAGGAHAAVPGSQTHVAAGERALVDTIGAGDSFMAATAAWLIRRGWPPAPDLGPAELTDLMTFASAAAAITCSRAGADPPWSTELEIGMQR